MGRWKNAVNKATNVVKKAAPIINPAIAIQQAAAKKILPKGVVNKTLDKVSGGAIKNPLQAIGAISTGGFSALATKAYNKNQENKDKAGRVAAVKAQEQEAYNKTTAGQADAFKNKYGFQGSADPTILQGQQSGLGMSEAMTGQTVGENKAAVQDVLGRYKGQMDQTDPISQRLLNQGSRQANLAQMKNPNVSARALSAIKNQGDQAATENLYKTQQTALDKYKSVVNNLSSGMQQNMWAGAQLAKSGTVPPPVQQQDQNWLSSIFG